MHFSVWSSPLSGHEVLAFYIAKIPNVTVILAVNRAPMSHISRIVVVSNCTGKSFSEALILASTNPQYGKRLFIDLPVQYMKITSSEHVVYMNCLLFLFWHSKQFMCTCSKLVIFMYWTGKSMNNLLSYFRLVDPRISASDKDLSVECQGTLRTWS